MMRIEVKSRAAAVALAIALALSACANLDAVAPGTPADSVAAARGNPYRVWPEANGAASWEYPTGPSNRYTYMVRIGGDGRVTRVDQVLGWPYFERLQNGMTEQEVEHVLGRPYSQTPLPLRNLTVYAWRWMETVWPRCFYAYFDAKGTLVETGVRDEETGDRGIVIARPC
jgi:hypothetical protein